MGDTFPSEDQSWRTSALSCSPFPPGITFATWVSSYSQQHCQWKRLESLSTRRRERERETPLIRRRRRMRFNIGWPVRGRGQLGKGSWSRWDTRTYDPRPLLVPLTNVSWHPPGHGPPPRGPPSSLNSRLGCIRDTGTRAQPNPESPLLPETVETVQLLAGLCSCLVIAYYLKGEGWYLKRYAKRVFLFFFFFEVMFFLWSFRVLFSNSSLRSLYSLSFKIFLI